MPSSEQAAVEASEFDHRVTRQQRLEALNHLAAGVAHEFNNVLQIVRGYVAFARDASPIESEVRSDLDHALLATDRAADLSARMLQFARAEDTGEGGLADASEAVSAVAQLLTPIIGEDIAIELDTESGLPLTAVSESSLREAVLNLCVNARDAMPSGGTLRLATGLIEGNAVGTVHVGQVSAGEYVEVRISDTGEGMAPGVLEHAFEPFFTTKPPGSGTGLGLAMIAGFVSGAGGAIRVVTGRREGSVFQILLPTQLVEDADEADFLPRRGERDDGPQVPAAPAGLLAMEQLGAEQL